LFAPAESKRLNGRWEPIAIFILVLACGGGFFAFVSLIAWFRKGCRREGATLHILVVSGLICSLGYFLAGDYGVAVITGSTIGLPTEKYQALYWVFFIFERVPLLTI
jgi:hypothetical protein